MKSTRGTIPFLVAFALLAGCSSRDDDSSDETTAATTAATTEVTTAATTAATTADTTAVTTEETTPQPTEPAEEPQATEIGVTESEIHIGVVADVDTPLAPGLSQPLVSAVQAWAERINSEGGLAGREIVVNVYDSKLNPDESANAYTQACQENFATVGSGAFVLLNPAPIVECADSNGDVIGLPDVAALAISPGQALAPTTYELVTAGQDYTATEPTYVVVQYGFDFLEERLAGTQPVLMGIDPGVPGIGPGILALLQSAVDRGAVSAGKVTYPDAAPQAEATPIVNQIRDQGVNWVTATSIGVAKLMAEGRVQGLDVDSIIWTCTSQCLTPSFVEQNADAIDGLYVSQLITPYFDLDVEGVAEYRSGVADDEVSANGELAYAAALAFEEFVNTLVEEQGINGLTRQNLLDLLASGPTVTAKGMLAEGTVMGTPSPCWVTNQVQGGEFVRVDPVESGEFRCDENAVVRVVGTFE